MDLDVFDVSNFVQVGDTQASLTFTSVADRIIQNVVTVIRSELPDAQVELVNFNGISDCDNRDYNIETVISNPESSDILPANTPISFFVLDNNGDEVFLDTFFTQNDIPINGTETQFLDISIPTSIPENTTLIVKVNTLADGSNPLNENNLINNIFQQNLLLASTPSPIALQNLSQCANLTDAIFNLEVAFTEIPNPNETLSFHLNLIDAQNNNNPITSPQSYNPSSSLETIYIRQSISNCFTTAQFDIETLEPPQLNTPTALTVCDTTNDQSGFAEFDLNSKILEITNGNPDYEVNFFLTQAEAEDLSITNGIASPFTNTIAFSQMVFVRVTEVNNNCVSFTTLDLEVNPVPAIADVSNIPDLESCDEDLSSDEVFDLTENNSIILNGLSPNAHQFQFYSTATDAEANTNEIFSPTAFISSGQVIYVRVTLTATACFSITTFALVVNPIPNLQAVPSNTVCDENNDGFAEFDLTLTENSILPDANGFSFQYFESLNDAQNEVNPITNPITYTNSQSVSQTLFVLVTNDMTGCQNIESFDIQVLENPIISSPTNLLACDNTGDQSGFSTFDLDSKIPEITGGNPNYEVNFFLTQAEAEDLTIFNGLSSPFTNTNAFSQVLFVRVTDDNTGCVSFTSLELEVVLQAEFIVTEDIPDLLVCDTDDTATFNLTEIEPIAVNDPGDFNITYHTSQSDAANGANPVANPTSFQNTETLQTLWIRVSTLNSLDNCFDTVSFQLVVGTLPIPGQPEKLEACDEDFDGIEVFDLSIQNEIIINGLPADENTISYHKTIFDAENDLDALDVNFSNENNPQTIYARLENNSSPQCFTIISFEIEVLESPFIESNEDLIICGDEPLVVSVDDSFDSYVWSTGNTTSSITVTEPGIYEVAGIIEYQDQNCETTATFQVSASGEATITELKVIDWRQDDNAIEIFVQGNGDYEFSIDGLNFQDSNIFEELTEYEYLVTVRDKNGCGETLRRVFLLDYPQFFTPNGDGFNDRWQIINSTREVFSKVYIFDRYGKLIANINPADNGWDGTKNGKPMPSNDYWFRVEREDGRVHTGHFTLKR